MIEENSLFELLKKYGIDPQNILGYKRGVLLSKTVDYVLSFLRTGLSISCKNIEKCPSILYCGVDNIKINYSFLKNAGFNVLRISKCLHILVFYVCPSFLVYFCVYLIIGGSID